MKITLSQHAEKLLRAQIARHSSSQEEIVERALEVLHAQDRWLMENQQAIDRKIQRGLDQLDQGQGISGETSRARLQEKKPIWIKQNESNA